VLKSFLPHLQDVTLTLSKPGAQLLDVVSGDVIQGFCVNQKTTFRLALLPMSHRVYRIE